MKWLLLVVSLMIVGCSTNPGKNQEPVEVEGQVTVSGKQVNNVILNLQPTGKGLPTSLTVTDSSIKGTVSPGRYTYYLSQASAGAGFESIPEKYREGSLDRQVDIKAAGPVAFAFD